MPNNVFIALGSNIEPRAERLRTAADSLAALGKVTAKSFVYETAPIGVLDQPDFLNAVVLLETELTPVALLEGLRSLEIALGRTPRRRWHEREIDFDIIFYNDLAFSTPDLTVPHPELQNRLFVLKPLADLDANFVHPILKKTVSELLAALDGDVNSIRKTDLPL